MDKTVLFRAMVFLALVSFSSSAIQTPPGIPSVESRVDAIFARWSKSSSPGGALAVVREGKIIYSKGYGMADLEHSVPISPETVFYIGSTSKQFTAMCILLLEEEGKLSLDDDIRKYLPEFPEYSRPITIRHLLHHTSGVRDYLALWSLSGKDYLDSMPEEEVYDMLCRQKELNFLPGEQYLYSNSCYFLLAMIIREASGESLREYAEKHVFSPLGMTSSRFQDDNTAIIKNRAFAYSQNENGEFGNLLMRFSLVGSGGLYTSVKDLYGWDQNFYSNQLGRKSPELIKKMHQNGRLNSGSEINYAYALQNGMYRGLKTVSHSGALGGYQAELLRFPEQHFSVILLGNLNSFNSPQLAYAVADIYLESLLDPQPSTIKQNTIERKEIAVDPELFDKYAGKYELGPGVLVDIFREGDRLMTQISGQPKFQLFPQSRTDFFLKAVDAQVTFEPDQKRLVIHQNGRDVTARRTEAVALKQDLSPFLGDYYSDELMVTYHVRREADTLYLKIGFNPKMELKPVGEDLFNASFLMRFRRNEKNEVTGLEVDAVRARGLKFVKRHP
jgi:CubicO group peptidase (beta-lactamase class C family)